LSAPRDTVDQRASQPWLSVKAHSLLQALALSVVVLLLALLGLRILSNGSGRALDAALAAGRPANAPDFSLRRLNGEESL